MRLKTTSLEDLSWSEGRVFGKLEDGGRRGLFGKMLTVVSLHDSLGCFDDDAKLSDCTGPESFLEVEPMRLCDALSGMSFPDVEVMPPPSPLDAQDKLGLKAEVLTFPLRPWFAFIGGCQILGGDGCIGETEGAVGGSDALKRKVDGILNQFNSFKSINIQSINLIQS